ncbi:acyl-CoA thioesterase/BAAT N-terminal domain-containing protein [Agromyces sp. NPDC058126]|uniref:acyl-CoA thioesterase/BAAT N-terminal domain-containing protein n=1 Tax=Agromyces sp. NPDC058126 TaxID=3346350 RepID=UPI0036DF4FE6
MRCSGARPAAIAVGLAGAVIASLVGCAPQAGPSGEPDAVILVEERAAPFRPLDLRLSGLEPNSTVTLSAAASIDWIMHRSEADLVADDHGEIDLAETAPVDGDWSIADPMAPFWALAPEGSGVPSFGSLGEPYEVELTLSSADGEELAGTVVTRGTQFEGLSIEPVDDDGLVGEFAAPAAAGAPGAEPRPAALVISGSEGGIAGARLVARQLAGAGYPALAVSYFGSPGQPTSLAEIPLEPFLTAVEWLRARPEVDPERVTPFGISRGGEVALWLAAVHPDLVRGAIAPVGAGELWCGYPEWRRSAWTLAGAPTPCTIDPADPVPASLLDLENVDGPLVLACGTADALWDSCRLMDRTRDRATSAGLDVTAITGDGASHFIAADPTQPAFAGTDAASDAAARAEFWSAAIRALGPPTAGG